jgi:hypothetical protein
MSSLVKIYFKHFPSTFYSLPLPRNPMAFGHKKWQKIAVLLHLFWQQQQQQQQQLT